MPRRSEWVLIAYFTYAAGCSLAMDVAPAVRHITLIINALVIAGLFLLARAEALRHRRLLTIMRDWYPLPLMLLAYKEMGWFAPRVHTYELEQSWIVWDRIVLHRLRLQDAIETLGPLLPSLLEVSYSLVYTIAPFCVGWLYYRRRAARVDAFLFAFLIGIFVSYSLFPYFPSEPPRTVFPNDDLPRVLTPFRRFNLGLLGSYGIHMSVFPSAHVSGAYAAAFAMRHVLAEEPWLWRFLLAMATCIATATVYGRYHYAVDAAAGFAVALAAWAAAWWAARRDGVR
jgi:membrane-associated phospholipid phosphatase